MFQRYTEKARRVVFFARYEASQFGSPYIETEHLLLGLLREDRALTNRFVRESPSVAPIRKQIEAHTTIRESISTSVDLPISNECKRVLAYAAEEAERLSHQHIGTEHLLLGLLREEKCFAAEMLHERGVRLEDVRKALADAPHYTAGPALRTQVEIEHAQHKEAESERLQSPVGLPFGVNLTQQAANGELPPLVGREHELDQVMQILCRMRRNNVVLVGEAGTGRRAIVEGLAQRTFNGEVPEGLAERCIVAISTSFSDRGAGDMQRLAQLLAVSNGLEIFLMDELHVPAETSVDGSAALRLLKPLVQKGKVQCISITTPSAYAKSIESHPWLEDCFQVVRLAALGEDETMKVLLGLKERYETFHGVTYSEEALQSAIALSKRFLVGLHFPEKAIDLIDDAGTALKLRQEPPPTEVSDARKRLKFVQQREDMAVQNHEFEKARFYSDEVGKQRKELQALEEKYQTGSAVVITVTPAEIEEAVARCTGLPLSTIRQAGESTKTDSNAGE